MSTHPLPSKNKTRPHFRNYSIRYFFPTEANRLIRQNRTPSPAKSTPSPIGDPQPYIMFAPLLSSHSQRNSNYPPNVQQGSYPDRPLRSSRTHLDRP